MSKEVIEVKKDDLRELYKTLTNYPQISKEQVKNEMQKCFGEDVFKPKNIMERVKTFEDACNELGEDNFFVKQYKALFGEICDDRDMVAYLKLRIITTALNEGWQPQFTEDEWRYLPWFYIYSKAEWDEMSEEDKSRVVGRSFNNASADGGVVCGVTDFASSGSDTNIGSRLAFKSEELAIYCGKQFIDIWVDYIC